MTDWLPQLVSRSLMMPLQQVRQTAMLLVVLEEVEVDPWYADPLPYQHQKEGKMAS